MDRIHACAQSYFASALGKLPALPRSYFTLLRTLPGSFGDLPAPRMGAAYAERLPYPVSKVLAYWSLKLKVKIRKLSVPFILHFSLYILHSQFCTISARWWILDAVSRRATASRKTVPTDIKDQPPHRYVTNHIFHPESAMIIIPQNPPFANG